MEIERTVLVAVTMPREYSDPWSLLRRNRRSLVSPRVSGVLVLQLFKWWAIALADQLLLVLLRPVNLECSVGTFVLATSLQ